MRRLRVSSIAERDLDRIWYRIAIKSGSMEIANGVVEGPRYKIQYQDYASQSPSSRSCAFFYLAYYNALLWFGADGEHPLDRSWAVLA